MGVGHGASSSVFCSGPGCSSGSRGKGEEGEEGEMDVYLRVLPLIASFSSLLPSPVSDGRLVRHIRGSAVLRQLALRPRHGARPYQFLTILPLGRSLVFQADRIPIPLTGRTETSPTPRPYGRSSTRTPTGISTPTRTLSSSSTSSPTTSRRRARSASTRRTSSPLFATSWLSALAPTPARP